MIPIMNKCECLDKKRSTGSLARFTHTKKGKVFQFWAKPRLKHLSFFASDAR
jgi:hypothetical protein